MIAGMGFEGVGSPEARVGFQSTRRAATRVMSS